MLKPTVSHPQIRDDVTFIHTHLVRGGLLMLLPAEHTTQPRHGLLHIDDRQTFGARTSISRLERQRPTSDEVGVEPRGDIKTIAPATGCSIQWPALLINADQK